MRSSRKKTSIIKMIVGGALFMALIPFVTMWLWNWLMPVIFGLTVITYWQALGLLILSKILFSGFSHSKYKSHSSKNHSPYYYHFKEKIKGMSEDEKKAYFQRHKFGMCNEPEKEKE